MYFDYTIDNATTLDGISTHLRSTIPNKHVDRAQ